MDEWAEAAERSAQGRTNPLPWRVLVLDASGSDPLWLIASVTTGSDVRAAVMRNCRFADWAEATAWVRGQVGARVRLVPVSAVVWRIDE